MDRKFRRIPECSACGRCCIEQGSGFTMMPDDYRRWKRQGRHDILRYIWQGEVPADYDGIWDVWIDWVDPETGENLDYCPFLRKLRRSKYSCAIYDTRPNICERFWCEGAYRIGKRGAPLYTHRSLIEIRSLRAIVPACGMPGNQ